MREYSKMELSSDLETIKISQMSLVKVIGLLEQVQRQCINKSQYNLYEERKKMLIKRVDEGNILKKYISKFIYKENRKD
ncbi:MAG: hypothetical protein KKA84_09350 [Bacteroidetes bacterium]|nr:hypothetical protein [Bacteroidota bacterium]